MMSILLSSKNGLPNNKRSLLNTTPLRGMILMLLPPHLGVRLLPLLQAPEMFHLHLHLYNW